MVGVSFDNFAAVGNALVQIALGEVNNGPLVPCFGEVRSFFDELVGPFKCFFGSLFGDKVANGGQLAVVFRG